MKVLLLNTFDTNSGSALAAQRLTQGLRSVGVDASMLVQKKLSQNPSVLGPQTKFEEIVAKASRALHNLPLKLRRQSVHSEFSVPWLPTKILPKVAQPSSRVASIKPDLINLHWVNYNYLQIEEITRLNVPVVWTMHDMWPFTGGCHYSGDCNRYGKTCGACPQLGSLNDQDLSRWVWQRKATAWSRANLTLVTPSSWLADRARESSLFCNQRIEVIPNGLDLDLYQPTPRQVARRTLNLPQDKKIVLFGAVNATQSRRKGFHLLQPALQQLAHSTWQEQIDLVVFGANPSDDQPDLGFKTHYLGKISDEKVLALAYAAADVFVAPSLQDNLPNTLVEAIACGTPCVAFQVGGIADIVEHQHNGYLAHPYHVEDLAQGIAWVLEHPDRHQKLCNRSRQKAEQEFTLGRQAKRYLALFDQVIDEYS